VATNFSLKSRFCQCLQCVRCFSPWNFRLKLKALLDPFGLTHYYTDKWGAYTRHLDPEQHTVSKRGTQKIERKHLTLRARIKRLVRKTI
jgi:insertion element IS1 protein InsB